MEEPDTITHIVCRRRKPEATTGGNGNKPLRGMARISVVQVCEAGKEKLQDEEDEACRRALEEAGSIRPPLARGWKKRSLLFLQMMR